MTQQLFAGLFTEGTSDIYFLQSIVQRTLESVAFECTGQIDIEVFPLKTTEKGLNFEQQVLNVSQKGTEEFGIQLLCVHSDADDITAKNTYLTKINPAKIALEKQNTEEYCTIFVALVPIQEMEAWMLADKELFKKEIGTDKNDTVLGIDNKPETIANPKEVIENAIRIAREGLTKKRRYSLNISHLYLPIGQSIDLSKLETLASYQDFKENVRQAFRELNLLYG
jgi:hypothetical protein